MKHGIGVDGIITHQEYFQQEYENKFHFEKSEKINMKTRRQSVIEVFHEGANCEAENWHHNYCLSIGRGKSVFRVNDYWLF